VRETKEDVIAWRGGVIGYVPDTAALADLVRLIVDIHGGEHPARPGGRRAAPPDRRHREPRIARNALSSHLRLPGANGGAELIATGLSDKEIARRLNISLATAKLHVHNLLATECTAPGPGGRPLHERVQHPG